MGSSPWSGAKSNKNHISLQKSYLLQQLTSVSMHIFPHLRVCRRRREETRLNGNFPTATANHSIFHSLLDHFFSLSLSFLSRFFFSDHFIPSFFLLQLLLLQSLHVIALLELSPTIFHFSLSPHFISPVYCACLEPTVAVAAAGAASETAATAAAAQLPDRMCYNLWVSQSVDPHFFTLQNRSSTDFKALNLWNVLSGLTSYIYLASNVI